MNSHSNQDSRSDSVPLGALLETGTIPIDSPFYVEREVDRLAEATLQSGHAVVIIKGYRQSGKSSLLLRLHSHGIEEGRRSCYLNFQALDERSARDSRAFFRQLAWMMVEELDSDVNPDDYLSEKMPTTLGLTHFVQDAVLARSESVVQILFDEVDLVFGAESLRTHFFSIIRAWHNHSAYEPNWRKLRLVLSHSTDSALWIADVRQSPFNVGISHMLADFDLLHIADLNRRYGQPLRNDVEIRRLAQLIGGHPYLVRLALWVLVQHKWRIEELETSAMMVDGPFAAHLDLYGRQIDQNPELAKALQQVIQNGNCDEQSYQRLWATGLVQHNDRRYVAMRCGLYRDYFRRRLLSVP